MLSILCFQHNRIENGVYLCGEKSVRKKRSQNRHGSLTLHTYTYTQTYRVEAAVEFMLAASDFAFWMWSNTSWRELLKVSSVKAAIVTFQLHSLAFELSTFASNISNMKRMDSELLGLFRWRHMLPKVAIAFVATCKVSKNQDMLHIFWVLHKLWHRVGTSYPSQSFP